MVAVAGVVLLAGCSAPGPGRFAEMANLQINGAIAVMLASAAQMHSSLHRLCTAYQDRKRAPAVPGTVRIRQPPRTRR